MNAGHVTDVLLDDIALALAVRAVRDRQLHLIAIQRSEDSDPATYRDAELAHRDLNRALADRPLLLLELSTTGQIAHARQLRLHGVDVEGYHVLRAEDPITPQAVAAAALRLRDMCAAQPHIHFSWPEGNDGLLFSILRLGLTPHRTFRYLHRTERDAARRPIVHVVG